MVCFRRGCQTSAVNMDFNRIWRKISICEHKPRRHFLGRVLNDFSCSHHAVLWPPNDATWLLPHHVQGAASLHLEHSSKPRAFPFLFSLCSPPPSRVLACLLWCGGCLWSREDSLTRRTAPLLHNRGGNAGDKQSWEGWKEGGSEDESGASKF